MVSWRWSLDTFVWGRLAICGRLVIGLSLWMLHWTGRLPIGRRLPTCPTSQKHKCPKLRERWYPATHRKIGLQVTNLSHIAPVFPEYAGLTPAVAVPRAAASPRRLRSRYERA